MSKLFQASTFKAMMGGNYDYTISIEYFLRNGDTGIGTYNGLNGEAIFLNGIAYNGTASGVVKIMDIPQTGVTFGLVTKFVDDVLPLEIGHFDTLDDLKEKLSVCLTKGPNYFYMIKATGLFSHISVQAAYKQRKPYRPMSIVQKELKHYTYSNVEGTLVGLYSPSYAGDMDILGWHMHFLSKDLTKGGHVTDLAGEKLTILTNLIDKWEIKLPINKEFITEDLQPKTDDSCLKDGLMAPAHKIESKADTPKNEEIEPSKEIVEKTDKA